MWKDREDHPSPFPVMSAITKRKASRVLQSKITASNKGVYAGSTIQKSWLTIRIWGSRVACFVERSRS